MADEWDEKARAWLHQYGIRTERYTAGGGDHPAMATLPAVLRAAYQQGQQDEREACAQVAEPNGRRPCDCDGCNCHNSDDAANVAAWDAASSIAAAIRSRSTNDAS